MIFALRISFFLGNIAKLQQALPKLEAPVRIRFSTCHMLFLGRVFSCTLIFSACLFVFVSGFVCCSCSLFAVLVLCSLLFGGLFCSPNGCVHNGEKTPVKTVKKTGCINLYSGAIVFFSSLSFWGVGGTWWHGPCYMLMTPPFFITPPSSKGPNSSKASI